MFLFFLKIFLRIFHIFLQFLFSYFFIEKKKLNRNCKNMRWIFALKYN